MLTVTKESPITGEENSMRLDVTLAQILMWKSGVLIQEAMPTLSATEREFLITGMSPKEQRELYSNLEE